MFPNTSNALFRTNVDYTRYIAIRCFAGNPRFSSAGLTADCLRTGIELYQYMKRQMPHDISGIQPGSGRIIQEVHRTDVSSNAATKTVSWSGPLLDRRLQDECQKHTYAAITRQFHRIKCLFCHWKQRWKTFIWYSDELCQPLNLQSFIPRCHFRNVFRTSLRLSCLAVSVRQL